MIKKDKFILLGMASGQVLTNFLISLLIVKEVGFGAELDVYYIGLAFYSFLTSSIGWSFSSILTPYLIESDGNEKEGAALFYITITSVLIAFCLQVALFLWPSIFYKNYTNLVSDSFIRSTNSTFILVFFIDCIAIFFTALHQKRNQYKKIITINAVTALIGLVVVWATISKIGIYSALLNQTMVRLSSLILLIKLKNGEIDGAIHFKKNVCSEIWGRMKYSFFGSFYYRSDELAERYITSYLSSGSLSLIAFIQRIYGAIITVINMVFSAPTITEFSCLHKKNDYCLLKERMQKSILLVVILLMPIYFIVAILGEKALILFFADKIPNELHRDVNVSLLCLFSLVAGKTIGMMQRSLLMSIRHEKITTISNAAIFTVNLPIKIALTIEYGIYGLLASICISEIATIIIQHLIVNKKLRELSHGQISLRIHTQDVI